MKAEFPVFGGRLTTESGVPVSTTDRTAQGTLYYTPFYHNKVATWNGAYFENITFPEFSLALTLTSGKNYDVFVYNNAGVAALELSAAWTNDTTRADALAYQNGTLVKSSDHTRVFIGTIRASGTNVTADSAGGTTTQVGGQRYVWNMYNQVRRGMSVIDTTNSWTYATDTIRQANGAAGNKNEYVTGDVGTLIQADLRGMYAGNTNSARAAKVGVGINSTTTFSGLVQGGFSGIVTAPTIYIALGASFNGYGSLGYNYVSWNEKGADGTSLFLGDNGGDGQQAGLNVTITN